MKTAVVAGREGQRLAEKLDSQKLPPILVKKQVAELVQCSGRQIELLVKAGQFPKPFYLSPQAPRWRTCEVFAFLGLNAE